MVPFARHACTNAGLAACITLATLSPGANAQALADGVLEQRRAQERETQQRQQNERRADVHLQATPAATAALVPASEQPCFPIRLVQLQGGHLQHFDWLLTHADGHEQLDTPDPVMGRCLGAQGIQTVIDRLQNALLSRGYTTSGERAGQRSVIACCRFTPLGWVCKLMSQAVLLSSTALWLAPLQTQAQSVATRIVADPTAARNQQATVLKTGNGVVQVNIQTPTRAGVSRNTYSQLDVGSQGAILNNSRTNTQTHLGGWVQGNPWLAAGPARVILNEVNASKPSQLQGYVEVAGQRAEVVIANPAGIVVNGGGFINATSATLTTGQAIMNNASLEGWRVQQGAIRVEGNGLDTRGADYTAILSRSAQINAGLWANRLQVVTGANQIDAATLGNDSPVQHSAIAPADTAPAYALDVGQLGGMYAGKILLIGTEAGLGVRNAGLLQASAGALTLSQEGWLANSGTLLATGGDVTVHTRGSLEQGGLIYSDHNTQLSTQASQTHSGTTAALGRVDIQASGTQADGTPARIQAGRSAVWAAGLQPDGQLSGQQTLSASRPPAATS